ncbi:MULTISPECIES: hypothetical protein [Romboutsia]|uniref:Uncharacterized protein n=1 Tax=Romboutsia hominis TaxID=1507512 RepID=A0A2P2BQV5_9FIRM|nr:MULTISPECIES: hypothetical protein [Romboutsia]MDB8804821.1 hypothetical protein [Romboutsia sp. 1001216sp1]MDB8808136.1 hypothetical protein [Romboutsia sp. 1001216sp1]MDB8810467.1 hypothetical protein [Romboutsia sp. 1001216sp1]MDB8816186.1 hypothetical protein [Romboutsia sp. 1001216sp1]MDB8818860.1 hypothetical protein [Romboutsia sp. 1001216sp1]
MDKRKKIIISTIVGVLIISGFFIFNKKEEKEVTITPTKKEENVSNKTESIEFLEAVAGIKANNVEIIKNPVGIKGEFIVPKEAILNGVNYFLEKTKNNKINKLSINIEDGYIKARVNYEIMKNITTPIEVKVIPSLNKDKDLVLNIEEVKLLDLKIANFIVDMGLNSFIKDWFPKEKGILVDFNEGNVIVHKENFKDIKLEKIKLNSKGLNIDMIINLENIMLKESK